ncbi:membrane steroid-binding protein 2-like [Populus alba x Populus x berolinensis]|nr:membrane steroid-binding protein 2-like [Populus alba x Populus x berolinensis]
MSFEDKDLTGDVSGLGPFELEALQDWEYRFMSKYIKVGTIKKTVPVTDGNSTSEPAAEATESDVAKPAEDVPSVAAPVETPAGGESKEEYLIFMAKQSLMKELFEHMFLANLAIYIMY